MNSFSRIVAANSTAAMLQRHYITFEGTCSKRRGQMGLLTAFWCNENHGLADGASLGGLAALRAASREISLSPATNQSQDKAGTSFLEPLKVVAKEEMQRITNPTTKKPAMNPKASLTALKTCSRAGALAADRRVERHGRCGSHQTLKESKHAYLHVFAGS